MEEKKNGKKFAMIIISTMIIASILVVIVISAFYELYDPTKYGRKHGGVNDQDRNTELIDQNNNSSNK